MTTEQYGRRPKAFSLIPNEILDTAPDYHIPMVWCAIWRHGNGSDEGCWASVDRLSKVARIGRDRTRSAIKWLRENGWLVAEERPGYTTRYLCTLEGGVRGMDGALPLNSPERAPLLDTRTPPGRQQGYPSWAPVGEQDPLEQDPNSLSSSGISDEIPTDEAANEFCSSVSDGFCLTPPGEPAAPKRKPRAKGDEQFEQFWKLYLSAPVRAASQSKPRALQQWQKTVRTESPATLLQALETELAHQRAAGGTFVCPLPDCFRWLRDERYAHVDERPITTANSIPDVIR
jgi:hypothetical protein